VRVESSCELVLWVQSSVSVSDFLLFVVKPLAFENEVLTFWVPVTEGVFSSTRKRKKTVNALK